MPSTAAYIAAWSIAHHRAILMGDDGASLDGFVNSIGILSLTRDDHTTAWFATAFEDLA